MSPSIPECGRCWLYQVGAIVVAIDLATGERTLVSDRTTGVGPTTVDLDGIAVAAGIVLVTDPFQNALLAIDPAESQRGITSR